jgi:hypothetical protein
VELALAAGLTDPLERLKALADLRDRGALSDEEFAVETAKILGDSLGGALAASRWRALRAWPRLR